MKTKGYSTGWLAWGVLGLGLLALTAGVMTLRKRAQPDPLPILGRVSTFALTNQLGHAVSGEALEGTIWVADIIFTRCPGPCLVMSRGLSRLQTELGDGDKVQLISLTADPEFDTVDVLRAYSQRFEANPKRWQFLTGLKKELYRFAIDDLKLSAEKIDPEQRNSLSDLFIHSTHLVLVDQAGQVRGYFDGTDVAVSARVLAAIRRLERES